MHDQMEVILHLRVRPQPVPHLNAGGDCGACVLAGLLGWGVRDVYERLFKGQIRPINRSAMVGAIWAADVASLVEDAPLAWDVPEELRPFGSVAHLQSGSWFCYVRMAVEAGYYGLAQVSHGKGGPTGRGADHWVMLCGVRERPVPAGPGVTRFERELLVSCSAKSTPDEEWVEVGAFLRERGGFNLILVRP